MYSKNPNTNRIESYAYLSEVEKRQRRIDNISNATLEEYLQKARAAHASASATVLLYDDGTAQHLGILKDAQAAVDETQSLLGDVQGMHTDTERLYNSVYTDGPGGTVSIQSAARQQELAVETADASSMGVSQFVCGPLLDCFVNTAVRIADLDLLKEVGRVAYAVSSSTYPFSASEVFDRTGFEHVGKDTNLMSVRYIDSLFTGSIKSWDADLPSLVDCQSPYAGGPGMPVFKDGALSRFTGSMPNLVNGAEFFSGESTSTGTPFHFGPKSNLMTEYDADFLRTDAAFGFAVHDEGATAEASDCQSLVRGERMFYRMKNLVGFRSDMSSLEDGREMFVDCNSFLGGGITGKTDFWEGPRMEFPNLADGHSMFENCRLSKNNVVSILDSLPYQKEGSAVHIHIGALGSVSASYTGDDIECLSKPGQSGGKYTVKPEVAAAIDSAVNMRNWLVDIVYYNGLGGGEEQVIDNIEGV